MRTRIVALCAALSGAFFVLPFVVAGDALAIPKSLRDYAIRIARFQNGGTIVNDTDGEIQFADASEDVSVGFGTSNTCVWSSDTGVVKQDFGATGTTLQLANDQTIVSDTDGEIQFADASEDISMGFATSNTLVWSSDTGVVAHDFGATGASLILANDETIKNDNDGEIELGDGSEDMAFSFGTNACVLSSDTGVVELDVGAVGTTLKLANDQVIVSDTADEIELGNGTEDISFGFGTSNEATVTTDTGVTRVDFEDIGVKTSLPLMMVRSAYFCGNGANATTAVYMPPVQVSTAADMTTYEYGAAGCDGLDNTTETSGDDYLEGNGALAAKVVGMACAISAAGTDDTYTFQLRDDAADVTGVTCDVTLDGAIQQCSVLLDAPVTVAAGSLWAVESAADTDDDVSSADVECVVFYTY